LHNPYAEFPLSLEILDAHHDRQWCAIEAAIPVGYGEWDAAAGPPEGPARGTLAS
jgi:hypothetical protein